MTKKKTADDFLTAAFRIAPTLALPISFVTSTHIVLGKKSGGKSYKAGVLAEEMLERGEQVVILDPTGAWWGLRSSADGRSVGYPITIFGGSHGDAPLDAGAGAALAEALVADRFSCLIDLTAFSKAEELRFCAAFLESLYRLNSEPLHLFLDEADVFAPQRPFGEEMRTLGACQSIVRRGRIKGIGITMITQRPQVLNKDVLSQADMLTCLRMNHPKDLGAIEEWVAVHGDPKLAKDMKATLPSLPKGDAWVWAPGEDLFARVTFRDKRTYDSGRTPKAGEKKTAPKVLAAVDLERIGRAMSEAVERAKANDPKHLRARIAELEKRLDGGDIEYEGVLKEENARLRRELAEARDWMKAQDDIVETCSAELRAIGDKAHEAGNAIVDALERGARPVPGATLAVPMKVKTGPTVKLAPASAARWQPSRAVPKAPVPEVAPAKASRSSGSLADGPERVLRALIQYPGGLTNEQLTIICGYKKSARNSHISILESGGLAERHGSLVVVTHSGRRELPNAEPLPTGKELRDYWRGQLADVQLAIFDEVLRAYPSAVPRSVLGEKTGVQKSARNAHIKELIARGVMVDNRGDGIKAADALYGVD